MDWTKEQKQAIEKKNANILVAAGAGSGKTTVLVSRIINKVLVDNVDIDKLLVVTFTNAAASEMKERLLTKLYDEIDHHPENANLQKQINLINHAHISTIHSFCLDVIRNNFFELGISANFRVGDETEIEIMKEEAIEKVFENNYESEDENFQTLLNMYTTYKDDKPLKDIILKMFEFTSSVPFPQKWLDEMIEEYDIDDDDFANTKWGKLIIDYTKSLAQGALKNFYHAKNVLSGNPELVDFCENINREIAFYEGLDYSNWNSIYNAVNSKEKNDWPRKSKLSEEAKGLKEFAKKIRDDIIKKTFDGKIKKLFIYDSDEAISDIKDMKQILEMIRNLLTQFNEEFTKSKKEKNVVDFSDIEHLALELLINDDGTKTEIAKKYDFDEIMCDEYQDSNLVQEQILQSVSNGHNIFMVGDVKQSIYRFREARPDLFLTKYTKYEKISEEAKDERELTNDTKILLYKNFRSRQNVVNFVNKIFQDIMGKKLGEIEYNEQEYLNFAAKFDEPKMNCETEIYVIDMAEEQDEIEQKTNEEESNIENEAVDKAVLEARLIARKIKELNEKGIAYRDMAILLRSPSVTAPIYEKELTEHKIPVFTDTSDDYLSSIEIDTILSLLKIIDNPLQDIPLVTVMRSVIGGFTDNDLMKIRLYDRNKAFYYALKKASEAQEETELKWKTQNFIEKIESFRNLEKELPLDEMIWKIYSETGYLNYVRLMPNGKLRQANLRKLFEKAKEYEKISFKGIFNFITFIEKVASKNSSGFKEAKVIGQNDDVVKIMSIHKSKGLEFPVCFIGGVGKEFNLKDMNDRIIFDQDVGIGVNYIDKKNLIEFPTLTKEAINIKMRRETISEEMRVLYVALTRAKEKLIIVGTDKDALKNISKIEEQIRNYYPKERDAKIDSSLVEKYIRYLDWIELSLEYSGKDDIKFEIVKKEELGEGAQEDEEVKIKTLNDVDLENFDEEKYKEIDGLLNWKYKKSLEEVPGKTSVTELKNRKIAINKEGNIEIEDDETFGVQGFGVQESENESQQKQKEMNQVHEKHKTSESTNAEISENTKFKNKVEIKQFVGDIEETELKANEKGSLVHLVLQKLNDRNIDETIKNLKITEKEMKFLNENREVFETYINSNLFKELESAKEIHKEEAFYMNVKYHQDTILVQGVIDLYYINKNDELILVDYKTDRNVDEEMLNERYKNQLMMYKNALEKSLKRKVDKTIIYSTSMAKEVEIIT